MKAVVALLIISIAFCFAVDIDFVGNVTLNGNEDNWKFRLSTATFWDRDPIDGDGFSYTSMSFDGDNKSLTGDVIWGAASVELGFVPTVTLQYASLDLYRNNAGASYGFLGSAYLRLEETAPNGTIVRVQSLKENVLETQFEWDTEKSGSTDELKWIRLAGNIDSEPWIIKLTFIVSSVVGVVNSAEAIVSPKSVESIVEITNWPYKSADNTLSLVIAVATGESHVKGNAVVSGKKEDDQVYFSLEKKAFVGGEKKDVSISGYSAASFDSTFENQNIKLQLQGVYASKTEVKQVRVTFPAGAADILYDPTVGAGLQIDNAGFTLIANSIFVVVLSVFAVLMM